MVGAVMDGSVRARNAMHVVMGIVVAALLMLWVALDRSCDSAVYAINDWQLIDGNQDTYGQSKGPRYDSESER